MTLKYFVYLILFIQMAMDQCVVDFSTILICSLREAAPTVEAESEDKKKRSSLTPNASVGKKSSGTSIEKKSSQSHVKTQPIEPVCIL